MIEKKDLDHQVAKDLGMRQEEVARITGAFLRLVMYGLCDTQEVNLQGFGRFKMREKKQRDNRYVGLETGLGGEKNRTRAVAVTRMFTVYFHKARAFKEVIWSIYGKQGQEDTLEKYGVSEEVGQVDLEKKAAEGCPACGRKVERHGDVLICPHCGSQPFESAKEKK